MIHHAKKSLGQNFLKSEQALRAMCETEEITNKDVVLEIGPGKGALTSKLLDKAKKVIAIEKDRDLIFLLREKFKNEIEKNKLELIEGDCLAFDPQSHTLKPGGYKLVANIPYNITGAIVRRFLSDISQPSLIVLLVQKEVAERIVARDKKESILSLSVQAYGTPKYVMKVGKRFFSPIPKVDSAIVAITRISRAHFKTKKEEDAFFSVVRAGFLHKRKVLRRNLEAVAKAENIDFIFKKLELSGNVRAEDLPISIWLVISRYLADTI